MSAASGSPRRERPPPAATPDPVETWGDFIALPENRSAVWAVRLLERAIHKPGRRPPFAPLVLHGPPGTGKSHLAAALVRQLADGPEVVTSQTVAAGDVARSAATRDADPGLSRAGFDDPDLRACDLLILEDVQYLPAKAADAAGDLLDRRTARRKATVVTANAGPAALGHLPNRFTSRLVAGLVVPLDPLSAASRRVLLEAAARFRGVRLTPDALDWLSGQATGGGIRPLFGALGNLATIAPSFPGPLDRTTVEAALSGTGQPTSAGPDVGAIVKRVAAAFGVGEKELLGPSRLRRVLVPRQVAMYLARDLTKLSLPRIGAAFAGRDHTTVLHACRKIEAELASDERLAGLVRQLRAEMG